MQEHTLRLHVDDTGVQRVGVEIVEVKDEGVEQLVGGVRETTSSVFPEVVNKEGELTSIVEDTPTEDVYARRGQEGVGARPVSSQSEDMVTVRVRIRRVDVGVFVPAVSP